jgi:hypothetical protein
MMGDGMTMIEPGLYRSVGETHRLIAQARRVRGEYLRRSVWQLVSWVTRRWSRNRPGERLVEPGAENVGTSKATSPADTLKQAA